MHRVLPFLLGLLTAVAVAAGAADGERWLVVDTVNHRLLVMQGTRPVHTFENIAIGSSGAARDRVRGDRRTPLGRFRVAWIREESRFHRFIGLDYPGPAAAERAFRDGIIDARDREAIRAAHRDGAVPPQDTPLGGQIGLHGIGAGAPEVHASANWTNGCVALTNEEIETLLEWVRVGTRVDIH